MSKLLALAMLCLVALLPLDALAQSMPYGTHATRWHHLTTALDGSVVDRSGWVYSFPVKVHTAAHARRVNKTVNRHANRAKHRNVPHARQKPARRAPVQRPAPAPRGRVQSWLITWYGPTGNPMASGIYPYVGAAACGYDVPLGTRIYVWGVGHFTCLDRIGYQPYFHADLFDVPVGSGHRNVTVY